MSSWKLLLVAATFTRPKFRFISRPLLWPFIHKGEISLRYWCSQRYLKIFLRTSELSSDFQSALELCARDTYHLDHGFHPDLVIDGGGNVGLFTLRVAAMESSAAKPPKFVIYEPMPHNSEQCRRHLAINRIDAEIVNACLGGTRRSIPFYCRGAIDSSFDAAKPYDSVLQMPVHLLKDAIGTYPAKRILIKLDIEGMEVEALSALLPTEERPVYVVGELHDVSVNLPALERLMEEHGWSFECGEVAGDQAIFRACSPAALPLLPSIMQIKGRAAAGRSIEMA
ncbi:FkbM family methyltransferase [Edaphobacter bradus]|uniref:FkbM family methyltransferase n=1 Tax=Edaphobacter bradus TaxID=2259016 RepID=UPI0021E02CBE|nr:FkbM family methyltransferase [Edaphobacter bradus]